MIHVLLALFLCCSCFALELPTTSFWSDDRKSVLWGDFMGKVLYEKCPNLNGVDPKHPVPEEDIFDLAPRYGDVISLSDVNSVPATVKEFDFTDYKALIWHFLPSTYFAIASFVLGLLVFICFAVLVTTICCRCDSKPERQASNPTGFALFLINFTYGTKLFMVAMAVAICIGAFVVIGLAFSPTGQIDYAVKNVYCQMYRLPYTLTFGAQYNQTKYLSLTRRDEFVVEPKGTWKGAVGLVTQINSVRDTFFNSENPEGVLQQFKELRGNATKEVLELVKKERDDINRLTDALAKTSQNLNALQADARHNHFCVMCTAIEKGKDKDTLATTDQSISNLETELDQLEANLEKTTNDPEYKDKLNQAEESMQLAYEMFSNVTRAYDFLNTKEELVIWISEIISNAFSGVVITFTVLSAIFLVIVGLFGFTLFQEENKENKENKPSPLFTVALPFTWSLLLFWAGLVLLVAPVLLAVGSILTDICQTAEVLVTRGGYESYPQVIDYLAPALNVTNEEAAKTLNSLLSWSGDGDASTLNVAAVKEQAQEAVADLIKEIKFRQVEIRRLVEDINLAEFGAQLKSASWVIMANFTAIQQNDPLIIVAFQEVLFSGLQVEPQHLDTRGLDKVNFGRSGNMTVAAAIQGFKTAEDKINEVLKKYQADKKLCFGTVTGCSTDTSAGTPKVVSETLDVDSDTDLTLWAASIIDAEDLTLSTRWLNSIKIMVWKLKILNATTPPFVMIDEANVETRVKYADFASPDLESKAYVNTLINEISVGFEKRLNVQIDKISGALDQLIGEVEGIVAGIPEIKELHRSILAELFIVKDSVCRGGAGSIRTAGVYWFSLAILEVVMGVVGWIIWRYLLPVEFSEDEDDEESGKSGSQDYSSHGSEEDTKSSRDVSASAYSGSFNDHESSSLIDSGELVYREASNSIGSEGSDASVYKKEKSPYFF